MLSTYENRYAEELMSVPCICSTFEMEEEAKGKRVRKVVTVESVMR